MRTRVLVAAAVAALVIAAAVAAFVLAGSDDRRQSVDGYLKEANQIQQRSAPAFKRAQEAYVAFARNASPSPALQQRLEAAERSMRRTRGELAELRPPDDAAEVHRRVLRVYDMSAGLARETVLLARYLPASTEALRPLGPATKRLQSGLKASSGAAGQQRALTQYAAAADGVLEDMRPLEPPPLLAGQHEAQVDNVASARSLALRLRTAIGDNDSKRVARLLLRFRKLEDGAATQQAAAARALQAYQGRYRAITLAQAGVRREVARLERSLD